MGEIISKEEFKVLREELKTKNKSIAHCHGVFDLVHLGHVKHFEEAKEMADVLVVSITAAKFVRKGPDRPYFNDTERMEFLSSIKYIDYVLLSEEYTGKDVIEVVRPDFWVKGMEYEDRSNDVTEVQDQEVTLVRKYGGDIRFTHGIRFSSSYLLNKTFASFSEQLRAFMYSFKERYSFLEIKDYIDKIKTLSVLVIGDIIIDEYIYCSSPEQMTKSMGYSTRILKTERSLGGSLAIARHAFSFADQVTILSVMGNEREILKQIECEMDAAINNEIINTKDEENYHTIIKTKYMVENEKRQELNKLFSVNNVSSPAIMPELSQAKLIQKLSDCIEDYDLVICCDFGHGLIDKEVIKILEEKAKFLAVNCQTNATNYGLNLITKYTNVDVFAVNQKELKLAMKNDFLSENENLACLKEKLAAKEGWLTRGSKGAYGIADNNKIAECPAVSTRVKDTVGAGDAFLTLSALASAAGAGNEISTLLGNVAGALAANIIGNSQAIDRNNVLKFISTLMNV